MNVTTEQLYEQAKQLLRAAVIDYGIAKEGEPPFLMACPDCGLPFRSDIEMGMVNDHAKTHGKSAEAGTLALQMVWIGEGPPPEPQP